MARGLSSSVPGESRHLLGDAELIFNGVCDGGFELENSCANHDANTSYDEANTGLLLRGVPGVTNMPGSTAASGTVASYPAGIAHALFAARIAACDGEIARAVDQLKRLLQSHPRLLVGWRELAACYELADQRHAAMAALDCGVRAVCAREAKRSQANVAPLHLHLGASQFLSGQAGEGLARVGDAFRGGKGGAVGHVLRGLISLKQGKASSATAAFARAREADPTIRTLVDQLAGVQARASPNETDYIDVK